MPEACAAWGKLARLAPPGSIVRSFLSRACGGIWLLLPCRSLLQGSSMRAFALAAHTALFAMASCTTAGRTPALELTAAASGPAVDCIDSMRGSAPRVVGPRAVVFAMNGRVTYRNDLPNACPGLGRAPDFKILLLELHGSRICRGDSFRAFDPAEGRAVGVQAFARCRLGVFTPIATPRRDRRSR